jgi:hypothetical protein
MPYESGDSYETARKLGHVPIVENDLVQEELGNFTTREPDPEDIPVAEYTTSIEELSNTGPDVEFLLSFDGSNLEVATSEEYPSNRIGFIQIAGVMTRLEVLDTQRQQKFVDPAQVKDLADVSLQDIVMPSTNYCLDGVETTTDSWRKQTFETFTTRYIEDQSLLEHFLAVIDGHNKRKSDGTVVVARCPNDCGEQDIPVDPETGSDCPCCGTTIYPTDTLRIHERVNEQQQNGRAISSLMTVIEHLTMAAYLRYLHEQMPERLSRVGFVIDGPLAQFDTYAWFHEPLLQTIKNIYAKQRELGYTPPVIAGVEKSGAFVDHAEAIRETLAPNTILSMDDDYIYNQIITSRNTGQAYGSNTYYGQKFMFKSGSGRIFCISVPKLPESGSPEHSAEAYPLLRKTTETLAKVETALYDDSLIPVSLAHENASIPLKSGGKVLELFAQDVQTGKKT